MSSINVQVKDFITIENHNEYNYMIHIVKKSGNWLYLQKQVSCYHLNHERMEDRKNMEKLYFNSKLL
jgi:hypothetical protein